MKVGVERLKNSRVELSVEVGVDTISTEIDDIIKALSQNYTVPGFRRGKAPRRIIERRFGRENIVRQAIEKAFPEIMENAIVESKLTPLETPSLEDFKIENENFSFKLAFDVFPEVELGEYKGIEAVEEEIIVTEEAVMQNLRAIQAQFGEIVSVEREDVRDGDIVIGSFELFVDGESIFEGEKDFGIKVGDGLPITSFEDEFIGAKKGEELEVSSILSKELVKYYNIEEYEEKEGLFKVRIQEIKEERIPELDDDFAKDVGEYETIDELKESIRNKLKEVSEEEAKARFERNIINKVVENSSCELPESLVEKNLLKELGNFKLNLDSQGIKYDDYLTHRNITEEVIKQELLPVAEYNTKQTLVLGKIAEVEELSVTDEEVDEEIQERIKVYSEEYRNNVEKFYESPQSREEVRNHLLSGKVIELLVSNAKKIKDGDILDESSSDSSRTDQ